MKTQTTNFTPGPSQLFYTVADHMRIAFREGIPSLSHRSKRAETIYKDIVEGLSELLDLPPSYHIFFTGSATEIWERIIQNLVRKNSFHLVNGSFSKRFYEVANQLHKVADKAEVLPGQGFSENITLPSDTELMAITHNETSTGVAIPLELIHKIKESAPQTLIAVDAVSSLPFPAFDYTKIDSAFFSVQKGFGLPAGLGVWMVNEACLQKAGQLLAEGASIGSYHSLPSLRDNAVKNQTPETPNLLGMYLLSKVIADMNRIGIKRIRSETEYKAAILYQVLENHNVLQPFVRDKRLQSKTVIVADTGEHTGKLTKRLLDLGLQPGAGYGPGKNSQLRFANFPTHSRENFELLVDCLSTY